MLRVLLAALLICAPAFTQSASTISDDTLWAHYEKWVGELKPLPPGKSVRWGEVYTAALADQGVSREEAAARIERINRLRRASVDRERTYWNAAFRLGGGPSSPLRLLQEATRKVKPGRALDAGMGRGRNTIFLAQTGWEAHGYDMASDGIVAAQAAAREAGVKLTTSQAKHEDFSFGENQWDLILCSYCYLDPNDARWAETFWKALKPQGLVVFQTSIGSKPADWSGISERWKKFHILRLEDQDPGYVDDDWLPSRTQRTVMLVARKE
jgi:2-polyprenyl-3-methyl-5-hydroxy-6-metoxy-1,4-benzoquinol methylase